MAYWAVGWQPKRVILPKSTGCIHFHWYCIHMVLCLCLYLYLQKAHPHIVTITITLRRATNYWKWPPNRVGSAPTCFTWGQLHKHCTLAIADKMHTEKYKIQNAHTAKCKIQNEHKVHSRYTHWSLLHCQSCMYAVQIHCSVKMHKMQAHVSPKSEQNGLRAHAPGGHQHCTPFHSNCIYKNPDPLTHWLVHHKF